MPETTLDPQEQQALDAAIRAFNTGDYYAAHDHFEALWGEPFWKGFVQAAVALHHYSVDNPRGLEGLPANVHRILDAYRPAYHGLDVEGFLQSFGAFFEAVARGAQPDTQDAPRIHRMPDAPRDAGRRHGENP